MGYRKFTTTEYSALRHQHNIMVLVGNGFDIQATLHYNSHFSPRYPAFYHYLLTRDFDSSNLVVKQMADAKAQGQQDWSDIEAAIEHPIGTGGAQPSAGEVYGATLAIQAAFSEYLELVAHPSLLTLIGEASAKNSLAVHSMTNFIGDIADRSSTFTSFNFPQETDHYDLFNYLFINLNTHPCWTITSFATPNSSSPPESISTPTETAPFIQIPPGTPRATGMRRLAGPATSAVR